MLGSIAALPFWQILLMVILPLSLLLAIPPYIIRRKYTYEVLKSSNQIAGFKFSMLGAVYAVLLAFVMLEAYREYNIIEERVQLEATSVSDIFRAVNGFSEPGRTELVNQLYRYSHDVVSKEWPMMKEGKDSEGTWKVFDSLWIKLLNYEPINAKESSFYDRAIDNMEKLGDYRRLRMISSQSQIPDVMWFIVLITGLITICFTYYFAGERLSVQMWMTGIVSCSILLFLTLILLMDNPFSSAISINSDAYKVAIQRMETVMHR